MTAAGVTLGGLGVLVGMAIGSGEAPRLIAQRAQPVEVRTEVIRKTVNVYRRAKPQHVAAAGPGAGRGGARSSAVGGAAVAATRTSGAHAAPVGSSAAPVVSTRTSGARSTSGAGTQSSGNVPVKTRTSGGGAAGGGSGSSRSVTTRSSGGGGHNGGGHDD